MEEHYISKRLYSKKQVNNIDKKIKLLGVSTKLDCYLFLNIRFFGMVLLFFLILSFNKFGYLIAPIVAFVYYKGIT